MNPTLPRTARPLPALLFACALAHAGCGGATTSPFGAVARDAGATDALGPSYPSVVCGGPGPCDAGSEPSTNAFDDAGYSVAHSGEDAGCPSGSSCSAGDTSSDGSTPTSACTPASLSCSGGATGYSCPPDQDRVGVQPNLACTSGTIDGYAVDYCCFAWPASAACAPFPGFPCDGNSYAFQCPSGTFPWTVDPKLTCGANFPDSNGENDFCCTFP